MPAIESELITAGDDYRARCEAMQKSLDEFRSAEEQVAAESGHVGHS